MVEEAEGLAWVAALVVLWMEMMELVLVAEAPEPVTVLMSTVEVVNLLMSGALE